MDIQKEKIAHEKHLLSQGVDFKYLPNIQYSELENVYELIEWDEEYSEALNEINSSWCTWQAKAQAVPEWIETAIQPPEEGQKVIISGIYGVGIAEFSYLYKDEFVMYDMGASNPILSKDQVKFWMPLPDAPQEPTND